MYAGGTNWPRWLMIINDVMSGGGYEGIQEELRGWVNVLNVHCMHVCNSQILNEKVKEHIKNRLNSATKSSFQY